MTLELFGPGLQREKKKNDQTDSHARRAQGHGGTQPSMGHPSVLPGQPLSASPLPQLGPEKLQVTQNLGLLLAWETVRGCTPSQATQPSATQPSPTLHACLCLIRRLGLRHLAGDPSWVSAGSWPNTPKISKLQLLKPPGPCQHGQGLGEHWGTLNWDMERTQLWRL